MPREASPPSARTVLLADDPTIVQSMRGSLLSRAEWRLLAASTVARAVDRARAEHPDVVILDADAWGPEAAAALRAERATASIPIVLVTASQSGTPDRADAVLRRPLDRSEIERVVSGLIDDRARTSRRRHAAVRASYLRAGVHVTAFTKDIGLDGAFLRTREALEPGESVAVIVELPHDPPETVRATAEVVRVVAPARDSHLVSGAAVRFVNLSPRDRRKLERFVVAGSADA
jgi:CheY-like chemotaxis protein